MYNSLRFETTINWYPCQRSLDMQVIECCSDSVCWFILSAPSFAKVCVLQFATAHELTTPGSAMSYSEFDDTRSKLKRKYVCPVCSKAFPVPAKMEIHMRTHTGDRPFACEYCGQRFSEKGNMQRHVKLKHSVTDLGSHTYTQGPYNRPAQDDGNVKDEDF